MTMAKPAVIDDDVAPSAAWVAQRFGVSVEEAEWVLVLYRFQVLYPDGPEPGRFYCEAL